MLGNDAVYRDVKILWRNECFFYVCEAEKPILYERRQRPKTEILLDRDSREFVALFVRRLECCADMLFGRFTRETFTRNMAAHNA